MRQALTVVVVAAVLAGIGYGVGAWLAGVTNDTIANGTSTLSGYGGQADRQKAWEYHTGLYKLMGTLFGLGLGLVITIVSVALPKGPKARQDKTIVVKGGHATA
ncbi:MAG TPA: hypothetical protein VEA69_10060 [Tepidisphaeraceae bacterium]|nr:hypothetical protein [Tepidisphaeraceae bacterium]